MSWDCALVDAPCAKTLSEAAVTWRTVVTFVTSFYYIIVLTNDLGLRSRRRPICVFFSLYVYVCVYIYMCVYTYACVYIYIYIYIYIHTSILITS